MVEGETRVVPVQAELDNFGGQLWPGMFAELEVLTHTPTSILVISNSSVVEANGKKLVYIQNGNAYQSAEVTLGQTSGDRVEVKSGLFDGDHVVTQGAMQLYAQSLRGGVPREDKETRGQRTRGQGDKGTRTNYKSSVFTSLVVSYSSFGRIDLLHFGQVVAPHPSWFLHR